jgi:hypothetical protein
MQWTSPYHAGTSIALTICLVAVSIALYGSIRSLWAEFKEPEQVGAKENPTAMAGERKQSGR